MASAPAQLDTPLAAAQAEQERLREQFTEIASLAGGLAHEIKNPLSTIRLNLELLAEDFHEPSDQRDRRALQKIERIQGETRRLEEVLDDFLRFCRVSELERIPTNVNEIVREVVDFHRPQLQAADVVIRDDLEPDVPSIPLDRDLMRQLLINLVLNAVHAMPNGGELILKTRHDDDRVLLDVIDTGTGMKPETRERIFKPFFSTRAGGSGLGLPTVRRIVDAHGGTLHVESEWGTGTAFTIELPRSPRATRIGELD